MSNRFNVLGLGCPLLDIYETVPKEFLGKYSLELDNEIAAEEKHLPLFKELSAKHTTAGGATLNAIRVAQWLLQNNESTAYIGCIGHDNNGTLLSKYAIDDGISVHFLEDEKTPTGTCAILLNDKKKSLVVNMSAANSFKDSDLDTWSPTWKNASIYYSAGFFLSVSPKSMMEMAEHASKTDGLYCLNLSAERIVTTFEEAIMDLLPFVDILFANATEALAFGKQHKFEDTSIKAIALEMSKIKKNCDRPRLVIITQGHGDVIVAQEEKISTFAVPQLETIVDLRGAGDAFVGGFLAAKSMGLDLKKSVEAGLYTAGLIIGVNGTTLEGKPEEGILANVLEDEKRFTHSKKRHQIRTEIFTSEKTYLESLDALSDEFIKTLQKEKVNAAKYDLNETDFDKMISNIPTLHNIHHVFFEEMKQVKLREIAVILNKYSNTFKCYTVYMNGFEDCRASMTKCENNKKGKEMIDNINIRMQNKLGQDIRSCLIMPVQRIPRYVMLLDQLLKHSTPGHPQYKNMSEALAKLKKLATWINEQQVKMERNKKLRRVSEKLVNHPPNFNLMKAHTVLIREGDLTVIMTSGVGSKSSMKIVRRRIFLFSDLILIAKVIGEEPKEKMHYKGSLALASVKVEETGSGPEGTEFAVGNNRTYTVFRCENVEEKESWMKSISEQVTKLKKIRNAKRKIARDRSFKKGEGSVTKMILSGLDNIGDGGMLRNSSSFKGSPRTNHKHSSRVSCSVSTNSVGSVNSTNSTCDGEDSFFPEKEEKNDNVHGGMAEFMSHVSNSPASLSRVVSTEYKKKKKEQAGRSTRALLPS